MSCKNHIKLFFKNGVRKIQFNRPENKNALNKTMYQDLTEILNKDAQNDDIVITILTGEGEYYSSGNDLKSAFNEGLSLAEPKSLIQAFIDYPKLLIAVINGPAIGIAATTATLCDIVYASDRAYFSTPFLQLGLCAEGTSSYGYPRILGRSKASECLLLNKKLSATEAYRLGFVAEIIPHNELENFIESLYQYGKLPVGAVKINKNLIMENYRDILTKVHEKEFETLEKCVDSDDFQQAVMKFIQIKSKL
ncbi:hypothetical protein ABEB36_001127 [Hypothenemus hampei]|uniref:Enoyl-CoA delta isomerase 2, mitochondrial n=1 Tax=Hypothenemus hampei TaxID=57062 RepID=A0ABD1FDJ9_HYPHA